MLRCPKDARKASLGRYFCPSSGTLGEKILRRSANIRHDFHLPVYVREYRRRARGNAPTEEYLAMTFVHGPEGVAFPADGPAKLRFFLGYVDDVVEDGVDQVSFAELSSNVWFFIGSSSDLVPAARTEQLNIYIFRCFPRGCLCVSFGPPASSVDSCTHTSLEGGIMFDIEVVAWGARVLLL